MPRPPRRSPLQNELFEKDTALLVPGTPAWTTLPEQTRRALTRLMTRLLIAHANVAASAPEDNDDDL